MFATEVTLLTSIVAVVFAPPVLSVITKFVNVKPENALSSIASELTAIG